jgi:hypothetical protein
VAMKNFRTGEVLTEADLDVYCVNIIHARKAAAESVTSSTVLQDDNDLQVQVAADSVYEVTGVLYHDGSVAGDLKLQWGGPVGITFRWAAVSTEPAAASTADVQVVEADTTSTVVVGGSAVEFGAVIRGLLTVGSTAGTFKLTWAQNASNATPTRLLAGSYICLRRVS